MGKAAPGKEGMAPGERHPQWMAREGPRCWIRLGAASAFIEIPGCNPDCEVQREVSGFFSLLIVRQVGYECY